MHRYLYTSFCLLVVSSLYAIEPQGWYLPALLANKTDSAWFRHELQLFANATKLSYTATWGSYYEPWEANATIGSGWIKSSLEANPKDGGMHALLFLNAQSHRALVAFRGSDQGSDKVSHDADNCADMILWQGIPYDDLPTEECGAFSRQQLDYLSNAIEFTNKAIQQFPDYDFIFTGHSLGAGMASLIAAAGHNGDCVPVNAGAVVFSTPGYINTLLNRTNLTISDIDTRRFLVFADQYDPVWVGCHASFEGGMIGRFCEWHNGTESLACITCEKDPQHINLNSRDCLECQAERHAFSHYLQLIKYFFNSTLHCSPKPEQPCLFKQKQCMPVISKGCSSL